MAHLKDKKTGKISGVTVTEAQAVARELWERRKEERTERLVQRQAARAARSDKEQLALLDQRFGKDKGATKERLKLEARILIDEQELSLKKPEKKKNRKRKGKKNV
jgi:hypothetical protein